MSTQPQEAVQPLTQLEFEREDFTIAKRLAERLGYKQYAYTSTSALWGLFCLAENPHTWRGPARALHAGCIIKTKELGFLFVQSLEDLRVEFRYVPTYINRNGLRTLMQAAQGRYTYSTAKAAETWIKQVTAENSRSRLISAYGAQAIDTFEVRAVEVWPEHHDPKYVYFYTEEV